MRLNTIKNRILIFSTAALIGLIILATSLRDFRFAPPQRIAWEQTTPVQFALKRIVSEISEIPAWKNIVFSALSLAIIGLTVSLLSSELRKRLLRAFIRFASFVFIFLFVIQHNPDLVTLLNPLTPGAGRTGPEGSKTLLPPPVFHAPNIPAPLVYLLSLSLVTIFLASIWVIQRWWQIRKPARSKTKTLAALASIANKSLDEMEAGKDWGDAIIRCYDRMSRVLAEKRDLHREQSMTPAEFAQKLEYAGLPHDPVHLLTHLFESVRYGARQARGDEIEEAAACLKAILKSCG